MEIFQVKISELNPAPYNPRKLGKKDEADLTESLKRFGFVEPIVANRRGNVVVGGHQRLKVARKLGMDSVPVAWVDLAPDKERELNLRLNKNLAEWDTEKLLKEFEHDLLKDVGFDLKDLGIKDDIVEDEVPEPPKEAKSKLGDIYLLGDHRLMCGDSTKAEDVAKLTAGEKADMVFTDPPYGVSYAAKNDFLNAYDKGARNQTPIENDHMNLGETSVFILKLFTQIKEILAERSSYYITAPQGGDLMMMMMMMQKAGIPLRHCLIWVKNNHVLGRTDYNYKHEPILYGWVKVHDFYGEGEHRFSTWEIDKPHKSDLHPTMKPVALIVNAIKNSTKTGQIVADLCGGSGSTLIACEQTGRKCRMMEIDSRYTDVIVSRYCKLTNNYDIIKNGEPYKWPHEC